MSFALSSIVRTRQKKSFFSLFILTLLFFCPLFPPSGVQAAEQEVIDSFDVHPVNRWTVAATGVTGSVADGLLNLSDIGDNTVDNYQIERDLRDVDGDIEIRFKYDVNSSSSSTSSVFYLRLHGSSSAHYLSLLVRKLQLNGYSETFLLFSDVDGAQKFIQLSGNERVYEDVWYKLRMTYNLLKSSTRLRLNFDNGSKVFDYYTYDINLNRLSLFGESVISINIFTSSFTIAIYHSLLIDYVKAPFKEREWTNFEAPVGFLSNSWFGCSAEDDIDDRSIWQLTVPYLDSVNGRISGDCLDSTALAAGEVMTTSFKILTADYDDGALLEAVEIRLRMEEQIAPLTGFGVTCVVEMDNVAVDNFPIRPIDDGDIPVIDFSFSLTEDRSRIIGSVIFTAVSTSPELYYESTFSVDLSDVSVKSSQEFILRTFYVFDFDGDTEFYGSIRNLQIFERDLLSLIVMEWLTPMIPGMIEDVKSGDDFFVLIFRWLGNLIAAAFEAVIGVLIFALEAALGLVKGAIEALEPLLTAITNAVGALVEYIQAIAAQIITALGNAAQTLLVALFDALVLVIDALADVVFAFWNAITGDWDLLALVNELLAYLIELIDWTLATFLDIVQLADDLSWIILTGWWIWALPVQWARAGGNPLAGLGNFIEVYFYDAMPWSVFGFHLYIPQGIIFTLWMILLLPETFILFTALGL